MMQTSRAGAAGFAAVLCLLATAPLVAHAQDCEPGTAFFNGRCRPCGALGQPVCVGAPRVASA